MNSVVPFAWQVPGVFRSRIGDRAGRQRIMTADGHLLILLHKVPPAGTSEREYALFWRDPSGDWISTESGSGLGALTTYFDEWRAVIDELEDVMSEPPQAENYFEVLQRTSPLLRTIRNTYRTMQDAREACPDREVLVARDEAGELERAVDLLHHDAKNGMEFMIARQGEEQARQSSRLVITGHRLNLLAAIFLPLTALGSIFAMHLENGLERWNAPWTFWSFVVGALVVGLLLVTAIVIETNRSRREMPTPVSRPSAPARKKRRN
jgi:hypothetical protein